MTKNEKTILIQGFKNISQNVADIIAVLEGADSKKLGTELTQDHSQEGTQEQEAAKEHAPEPTQEQETASEQKNVYTYEEVRAILAEKARIGFRAEVKAILTVHGVQQLSSVKDPDVYAAIVAEAEKIGNA